MKFLETAYTFDASAKTIVFTGYTSGSLQQKWLLLITNVLDGEIIYNAYDPAKGGTITPDAGGDILTLDFDTTSMSDTDELQIFMEDGNFAASDSTLSGIATDISSSLGALNTISSQLPVTIGQKAKAASLAVTLASDEDTLPVVEDNSAAIKTAVESIAGEDFATQTTLATRLSESDFDTKIGSLTETAPGTDTASSGLNGRLQRIAQRLTSLIALLPSSLGQKTKANSLAVTIASDQELALPSGAATETTLGTRLSESDFDTKIGSLTETAPASDTASSGLNGRLQRIAQRITSLIALLPTALSGSGNFKVAVQEALPAGSNAIGSVTAAGDVAHDAGDSGNPVKVGAKAANALPTAVSNGDRTNNISDLWGRQLTSHVDPAMQVAITKTSFNATTTQTGAAMWTPASGKRIALTSLIIGTYGTTAARVIIWIGASGDTTFNEGTDHCVFKASYAPSATVKPGSVYTPSLKPVYSQTADHILKITTDAGISIDVTWDGYEF